MNMAQFSAQPNDIATVSLTPLRRAVQRIQAVCARLTERGMSRTSLSTKRYCRGLNDTISNSAAYVTSGGMTAPDGAEPHKRDRAGTLPGKWPFPPTAADATPVPTAGATVRGPRASSLGNATIKPESDRVSVKSMVLDVVLVLAWGAMIPAFMWLGVAGGF